MKRIMWTPRLSCVALSDAPKYVVSRSRLRSSRERASTIEGSTYLFLANFAGIKAGETVTPTPQLDVRIDVPSHLGTSMHLLPYLGVESVLRGQRSGDGVTFVIPQIERGAVVWFK